jgi:gliding motility-associated-like protein
VWNGCERDTSLAAALTVNDTVEIENQPVSQNGCEGDDITFTSTVSGDINNLQWETDAGGGWSNISGATTSDLTINDISNSDEGNYRLVIDGVCFDDTTNEVSLAVSDTVTITDDPSPVTVCEGENATFSVTATGEAPLEYQWYTNAGGSWSDISGATSDSYTVTDVSNADAGDYRVEVWNGCERDTSLAAALTVNDTVEIIKQPTDQFICENNNATFTVDAEGYGSLSYTWEYNDGSGWESLTTAGDITVDKDTLTIANADTTDEGNYRCIIDNSCGSDTTNIANLDINWFEVNIGEPSPFSIDTNSTKIKVHVDISNHDFIYDLSYELVTPGGNTVLLADTGSYEHNYSNASLTFTSELSTIFDVNDDSPNGNYGIKSSLTNLHGKDPSNGAWSLRIGDWVRWGGRPDGFIDSVYIGFTDAHSQTGDTTTVSYNENTSIQIKENSGLSGSVAYTDYVIEDKLSVDCYGDSTATAIVSTFGGIPPYSIEWSTTSDFNSTIPEFSGEDTVELSAGTFYVKVIDGLGCEAIDSITVTQPPEIILDSLEVLSIDEQNGCLGDSIGEVHDSAYGGTGTLHYELIKDPFSTPDTIDTNTTGDFTGLAAGFYMLEVFDDNGCIKDTTFNITEPDSIQITYENYTSLTDSTASDGTIDIYAEGGTSPLTYTLYDSIAEPDTIVSSVTTTDTANFTGLAESDYYVLVNDANGCDTTQSSIFSITAMQITFSIDSTTCPGDSSGQIVAEIIGGISPYTYQWTKLPSNDPLKILKDTSATSDTLRNIPAGQYVLNVIDDNDYSRRDTAEVEDPAPMIINVLPDSTVNCYNAADTFEVDITNGVPPYDVNWYNSSGVLVSDTNKALLFAGKHFIEAYDNNGCYMYDSITITQPDEIKIDSISPDYPAPYGLDIKASGGNDSLYIYLSNNETNTTVYPDSASYTPSNGVTFAKFDSIMSGTYKVIATDSICEADTLTITIPISVELSILDSIQCNGDNNGVLEAEVIGTSNNRPYTFAWSEGTTNTLNTNTDTLSGLSADNYSVTVTDKYDMTATASITLNDPPAFTINETIDSAYCREGQFVYGNDQGAIYLEVSGGRPYADSIAGFRYKYSWDDAQNTNQPIGGLDSLTEIGSGNHSVTVYDRYGCQESASFDVPVSEKHKLEAYAGIVTHQGTSINEKLEVCPYDSLELQAISLTNADSAYWQVFQDDFIPVDDFADSLQVSAREDLVYYLIARNEKCRDVVRAGMTEFHPSPELRFTSFNNTDVRNKDSVNVLEKNETANITAEAIDSIATSYTWGDNTSFFQSVNELTAVLNIEAVQDAGLNETRVSIETKTGDTSNVTGEICSFSDQLLVSIIPNVDPVDAFSPNGDGNNDEWLLKYGSEYDNLEVIIFNRWGVQVYRKKGNFDRSDDYYGYIKAWDGKTKGGKDLPTGTYYYIIDPHVTGVKILRGTVTLIR